MSSQNIYFQSFAGDKIYFHLTSEHIIYFKIQPICILMDAGLFIYLSRDPGQNIVFKVFDGQDIYVKKLPATPPPDSTVHPLTKSKY